MGILVLAGNFPFPKLVSPRALQKRRAQHSGYLPMEVFPLGSSRSMGLFVEHHESLVCLKITN